MAAAGEEAESSAAAGERRRVPFARGGPVFVPFMVGPMSTVPEFMSSALSELQSLQDELGDTGDEFDDELSVDELRVLSEEELVERALREAMEEGWDSGAPTQPEDQRFDGGMSASSAPGNGTVTSSPSVERESSRSPIEGMAIVLYEPQGSNGKTSGGGGETRGRKGKNGTLTSDSSVGREIPGSPVDMATVPYEPQGSKGKTRDGKGKPRSRKGKNGTVSSNLSVESERPVSPIKDMPVVPHDPEGTDGQTKCRKSKKRGRHFDREVRAHILHGSYLTKAEKMAEIKVKQEEDKHAARLHSFSADSMMSKGSKASAEKIDMARSLKYIDAPWKNKASKSEEHRPVAYPEVILCVEIYEKGYGSVKNQEFLVLGSQLLTDLKDNIYCLTDKLMEVAKQHDHSGYFLIEDTFYNDTRHYSAVDYSKPILDWFKNSSNEVVEKWDSITSGVLKKRQKELLHGLSISNVPEFKSAKMQKTRFSDLHFRLGAGYLYFHQCIKDLLLDEISALLKRNGSKISSFNLPARSSCASHYHINTMISDELSYDITELANESTRLCSMLNPDQKNAFECVVSRIAHNQTGFFFVSRHGGTAKTFLWNAIITYLRSTTMLTYRLQVPLKNMLLIPLLMTKPIPLKDKNAVPIIVFYRTGLFFILYMQAVMKAVLK